MPWLLFIFMASLPLNSCAPSVTAPEHPLAAQGDAKVQVNLGVRYMTGPGVSQDSKEAARWFRKAAEQGDKEAQNNLGSMYVQGQGVQRNYVLAHMWFSLAGTKGVEEAVKNRNIIEKRMTPSQIQEAKRLATEWKPKKSQ